MNPDLALWEQELADVPSFEELGAEALVNANAAWESLPVRPPERSLLVILRIGRRLRKLLRIG